MKKILDSTETAGDALQVRGGDYQIVVADYVAEVTLQMQAPEKDPVEWINTLTTWDDDGPQLVTLSGEAIYRLSASSAGAEAFVQTLVRFDVPTRI